MPPILCIPGPWGVNVQTAWRFPSATCIICHVCRSELSDGDICVQGLRDLPTCKGFKCTKLNGETQLGSRQRQTRQSGLCRPQASLRLCVQELHGAAQEVVAIQAEALASKPDAPELLGGRSSEGLNQLMSLRRGSPPEAAQSGSAPGQPELQLFFVWLVRAETKTAAGGQGEVEITRVQQLRHRWVSLAT